MTKKLIVIAGPTAVGKTSCAIKVAKHFDTEIINADSRQIYKELEIGTAKPTEKERAEVKHHFVDILSIGEDYTAGRYEHDALARIEDLFKTNDYLVLSGGTGFYINAVTEGLDEMPKSDSGIRELLMQEIERDGLEPLLHELEERDVETYNIIDKANTHRVLRALEVIRSSGKPYSSFKKAAKKERPFDIVKIALELPREQLYERINKRVDEMMNAGLLEEVAKYKEFQHNQALQTVGYKELFSYLDGEMDLAKAVELIKRNSRRYAKRQITWLKKNEDYTWLAPNDLSKIIRLIG